MYVKYSEYGERYLSHKNFLHLCSDLGLEEQGISMNEKWLAYLEKNKILLPEFKLVKPIWYLNYLLKNNNEQLEKIKSKRWQQLDQFINQIEQWHFKYFIFHPFDRKKTKSDYL